MEFIFVLLFIFWSIIGISRIIDNHINDDQFDSGEFGRYVNEHTIDFLIGGFISWGILIGCLMYNLMDKICGVNKND